MSNRPQAFAANRPPGAVKKAVVIAWFRSAVVPRLNALVGHVGKRRHLASYVGTCLERFGGTGAACPFPLRFRWQCYPPATLLRKPMAEGHCLMPSYADDRQIGRVDGCATMLPILPAFVNHTIVMFGIEAVELLVGHFVTSEIKRPVDRDNRLRSFIVETA